MDTNEKYIKMCKEAVKKSNIGEDYKKLSPEIKLGTRICFRSFIGMVTLMKKERDESGIVGITPETLVMRIWNEKNHGLRIIKINQSFTDEGFPLFRQDQLQDMIKEPLEDLIGNFYYENVFHTLGDIKYRNQKIYELFDRVKQFKSMEQLWLAFIMREKYNKIWLDEEWINEYI